MRRQWSGVGLTVFLMAGCAGKTQSTDSLLPAEVKNPRCFLQTSGKAGVVTSRHYDRFEISVEAGEAEKAEKAGGPSEELLRVIIGSHSGSSHGHPCPERMRKKAPPGSPEEPPPGSPEKLPPGSREEPPCYPCLQLLPLLNSQAAGPITARLGPDATLTVTDSVNQTQEFKGGEEFTLPSSIVKMTMQCAGEPPSGKQ